MSAAGIFSDLQIAEEPGNPIPRVLRGRGDLPLKSYAPLMVCCAHDHARPPERTRP
ncbi:predicted protein [Streptomyces sp. AA4]|nr:predicted protein [Streptomyces sp. AA4]